MGGAAERSGVQVILYYIRPAWATGEPPATHTHKRKQMTWPGPSLYREEPACPKLPAQLMTLQGIDSALCLLPQSRATCSRVEAPQELICESSPFPEQGTRPHTDLGAPRFLSLECSLHVHTQTWGLLASSPWSAACTPTIPVICFQTPVYWFVGALGSQAWVAYSFLEKAALSLEFFLS